MPSQVHLDENGKEIPALVEVIWPENNLVNGINQVSITFATADHSDPRDNGRVYQLFWDWKPGIFPLLISLILMLVIINFLAVLFWKRISLTVLPESFPQLTFQRKFLTGMIIFLLNVSLLAAVFVIISILVKNHLDQSLVDSLVWPAYWFRPEQVERTQFLAGLLLFPLASFIGWYLLKNLKLISERAVTILFPVLSLETVIGLGVILFYALQRNGAFYIQGIALYQFPWMVLGIDLLLILAAYYENKHPSKWLTRLSGTVVVVSLLAVLVFIFFASFITEYDPYMYGLTPHFSAYMYSIDQVFKGKTILFDISTQYGFYPYFLEPIFKFIGMGISQVTVLMSVEMVVFFIIIFFIASRMVKSRLVYACAVWVIPGAVLWERNNYANYENQFQYWPHRVLFPGLILLVIWLYQKASGSVKTIIFYSAYLLCGIGLLWNFDTGVIVLLCWTIFRGWEALGRWHKLGAKKTILTMVLAVVYALIVSILSFGLVYLYTFFRSGHFPDFNNYFYYQFIFYGSGFGMLPIPPWFHLWMFVALTYALGLYLAISRMCQNLGEKNRPVDRQADIRNNMIFIISVMGAGLFSYYQGRSHDANLLVTFWSAWLLFVLFADDVFQQFFAYFRKPSSIPGMAFDPGMGVWFLFVSLVLFSYTAGAISISPGLVNRVQSDISSAVKLEQGTASPRAADITLINKYFKPGEKVLILAYSDQAYLYIKSGTVNPLNIPSFSELFTKTDSQKVTTYLNETKNAKVIMAKDFGSIFPDLYKQVFQHYTVVEQDQNVIVLEHKAE